jgi:hypothetical protein
MAFTNKLNYKAEGHVITDEVVVVSQTDKSFKLLHHNVMGELGVTVWSGMGQTGIKITDFTLSTDSEKSWVKVLTFGETVLDGTYYVTYYSQGDKNDADDFNALANDVEGLKSNLIARYVHTSNTEIQPIALDLTTGIFTTETPLGLPVGAIRNVVPRMNYMFNGCIPREFKPIDAHKIEVIDDYHFYLLAENVKLTSYPHTANTAVDVSTFRFEYGYGMNTTIDLSGLNLQSFRVVVRGQRQRGGWAYHYLNADHSKGNFNTFFSGITDGRDFQSVMFEMDFRYAPTNNMFFHQVTNAMWTIWNESNGTWTHNASSTNLGQYINVWEDLKYNSFRVGYGITNGTVVEIYNTGWDK